MNTTQCELIPHSWKFSRDLYFKNFVVQTKFVKYKTLKYLESENYFLDIANESKFVKYRALENNQLHIRYNVMNKFSALNSALTQQK